MTKNKTICDVHTHGWNDPNVGKGLLGLLSELPLRLYEYPHTGRALLEMCEKKFPNTDTLIALANQPLPRDNANYLFYEPVVNSILRNQAYKGRIDDNHINTYIVVEGEKADRVIARANEPVTPEGHCLLLFLSKNVIPGPIIDVLKWARDEEDAVIGADHPLMLSNYVIEKSRFPQKQILKAKKRLGDWFSEGGRMSIGYEGLQKYRAYLEFIETINSNCPELEQLTSQVAKEFNLPGIANSDAHRVAQVFSSYTVMHDLDCKNSNPDRLRESYRRALLSPDTKLVAGANGIEGSAHFVIGSYNIARQAIGLLKRKPITIEKP